MLGGLYGRWMYAWETALTTRDSNRIVRPVEWGFEWLEDFIASQRLADSLFGAGQSGPRDEETAERAMLELNRAIVDRSDAFYSYRRPTDFRLEERYPELFPTNVRPETLAQAARIRQMAAEGKSETAPFLRFTSPVRTPYPENDLVNARWYPADTAASQDRSPGTSADTPASQDRSPETPADTAASQDRSPGTSAPSGKVAGKPKQAIVVMPQWNADAFSHNVLCKLFNRFGISALRLSKPYHDIRRPAELERSDYAVSSNIGRTISACRQAVIDIRCCLDWLEEQGYEQFGVLGTSLGSCYGFIAAAHDPRLEVCAFNHASMAFGDVVWTGQSTRHIREAFAPIMSHEKLRDLFLAVSPVAYMERFGVTPKRVLVVHAKYDLTFIRKYSLEVLENFRRLGVDFVSKVLPCGHYTTGETPFKFLDGWYLGSFVYSAFKKLAGKPRTPARAVKDELVAQ